MQLKNVIGKYLAKTPFLLRQKVYPFKLELPISRVMEFQTQEVLLIFSSVPPSGQRWATNLEVVMVASLELVLALSHANPIHTTGWFNASLRKTWRVSVKEAWREAKNL